MPPAKFSRHHRLSVWRDYRLHMHCCRCEQRSTHIEVAGLIRWHGDKTFTELLPRLRCMFCKQRPTFLSLAPNIVRDAGETQGATWNLVLMTGGGE
jgi:hypothetical protein